MILPGNDGAGEYGGSFKESWKVGKTGEDCCYLQELAVPMTLSHHEVEPDSKLTSHLNPLHKSLKSTEKHEKKSKSYPTVYMIAFQRGASLPGAL